MTFEKLFSQILSFTSTRLLIYKPNLGCWVWCILFTFCHAILWSNIQWSFPHLWQGKKSTAVSHADTEAAEYPQKICSSVRSMIWYITTDAGSSQQKQPNQLLQSSLSWTATTSMKDTYSWLHTALCLREVASSKICSYLFYR